ncbi:MAG: CDP-alcohol phosphatidyltransferase family protein [Rhizobiaceae bacterium]
MFDGKMRHAIEPLLNRMGAGLASVGLSANAVTLIAFGLGLSAMAAIASGQLLSGLVLVLASRLADGLDGAVARATRGTDFGGFLDIVLDFAFYGMIPLAFVLLDPAANGLAGAFLITSFYVNGASFLAYAIMAEKRGLKTKARGTKSLFFTTGLAEATETLAVFCAMCLLPTWFGLLAWIFGAICFYTALARILEARTAFTD